MTAAARKSKWSPGPWRVNKYGSIGGGASGIEPVVATVRPFFGVDRRYGDSRANAMLIAAAPELYKALVAASHALRSYQYGNASPDLAEEIAEGADAVLAKARGEGLGSAYTCPHCGMVSHNPNDAKHGYCGACHRWAVEP